MAFCVTSEGRLLRVTGDPRHEVNRSGATFSNEEELREIAAAWPMKHLLQIWNGLPSVKLVSKFENRRIAIGRIWRAIANEDQSHGKPARSSHAQPSDHARFRSGSKAAQVCRLIERPQGATLEEIRRATGWQAHTVRGFISRTLGKHGRVSRSLRRNGERAYRVRI